MAASAAVAEAAAVEAAVAADPPSDNVTPYDIALVGIVFAHARSGLGSLPFAHGDW